MEHATHGVPAGCGFQGLGSSTQDSCYDTHRVNGISNYSPHLVPTPYSNSERKRCLVSTRASANQPRMHLFKCVSGYMGSQ